MAEPTIKIGPSAGENRARRNARAGADRQHGTRFLEVELTPHELMIAAEVGAKRHARSVLAGRKDYGGYRGGGWDIHIEGACGELAVAKGLGLYWSGMGQGIEDDTDVSGLQVRTRSRHSYELYIWPKDDPASNFVLVTGTGVIFRLQGWYEAARAQAHPQWLTSPTGREKAFFVPNDQLHSLSTIPRPEAPK